MKHARAVLSASLIMILAVGLIAPLVWHPAVEAAETGEYPWSDATLLNKSTYDFGYATCQPHMQTAGVCDVHVLQKDGITYHLSDPWLYDVRNCTSYVAWRVNKDYGVSIAGWGNATQWAQKARESGHEVDGTPRVGDIAYWSSGYGHVAYVVAVNPDGSVNVEQYNRAGTGEFSRESRTRAERYIHVAPTAKTTESAEPVQTTSNPSGEVPSVTLLPHVAPNPQPVPLPQAIPGGPLPATASEQYDIVKQPQTGHVVVYQIKFNQTTSGYVELSVSNYESGNAVWDHTWVVDQLSHANKEVTYRLADNNADGGLDLYQIKYAHTTSNHTEVRIFDGAKDYATIAGAWPTGQPTQDPQTVQYEVADHNGDGSLDIYKLVASAGAQNITILDGATQFSKETGSWQVETAATTERQYTVLGDDDRDGKIDILTVSSYWEPTYPEVVVLSGAEEYRRTRSWREAGDEYKTSQP